MALSEQALQELFFDARTAHGFQPTPISDALLERAYDLAKMGPTSMNCQPARFLFLRTPAAKARLLPCLMKGNVEQTQAAPVTAIIATDTRFYERMPEVWHDPSAEGMFADRPAFAMDTAVRNGTLQGAYFILAARAVGLDCGPMSGFSADKVNAEFFPDGRYRVNFLVNLGIGDPSVLHPRSPRLPFSTACVCL